MENTPISEYTPPQNTESSFDGSTLSLLGWHLLGGLLTLFTLGIGAPWAQCMILRWETKHTTIGGRRLQFDGKGGQLLCKYLLWGLLTTITFGIYALCIPVRMQRWRVKHTRFADEVPQPEAKSSTPGWAIALIVVGVLVILGMVGLGVAAIFGIAPTRAVKNREPQLDPDTSYVFYWNGGNGVILSPDENQSVIQAQAYYVTPAAGLTVRSGPGTDYDRLDFLTQGQQVWVERWENGWAYIGAGWVSGDYLSTEPVEVTQPEQSTPVQPDPVQPESASDPNDFLNPTPPVDGSLEGSWVFAYNLYRTDLGDGQIHTHCQAIQLTLYANGTFRQNGCMMMFTDGQWYYPGGDEPGPHYAGEYSFDGHTLVLRYKAREYNNYVEVSPAEPPMWVSSQWRAHSHQATLTVGALNSDGSQLSRSVSGTNTLPIYMEGDARHATYLYREAGYESLYLIDYFNKVLPMFYWSNN